MDHVALAAMHLWNNGAGLCGVQKILMAVFAAVVQEGGQGLDRLDLRLLCSSGEATGASRGGSRLLAAVAAQRSPRGTRARRSCHV